MPLKRSTLSLRGKGNRGRHRNKRHAAVNSDTMMPLPPSFDLTRLWASWFWTEVSLLISLVDERRRFLLWNTKKSPLPQLRSPCWSWCIWYSHSTPRGRLAYERRGDTRLKETLKEKLDLQRLTVRLGPTVIYYLLFIIKNWVIV